MRLLNTGRPGAIGPYPTPQQAEDVHALITSLHGASTSLSHRQLQRLPPQLQVGIQCRHPPSLYALNLQGTTQSTPARVDAVVQAVRDSVPGMWQGSWGRRATPPWRLETNPNDCSCCMCDDISQVRMQGLKGKAHSTNHPAQPPASKQQRASVKRKLLPDRFVCCAFMFFSQRVCSLGHGGVTHAMCIYVTRELACSVCHVYVCHQGTGPAHRPLAASRNSKRNWVAGRAAGSNRSLARRCVRKEPQHPCAGHCSTGQSDTCNHNTSR